MTLLIGTVARSRKAHVVITADGRCTGFDGVTRSVLSDCYQKIFPIPDIPIVIAHHGENVIAGRSVRELLSVFADEQSDLTSATIEHLADALACYTDEIARTTLRTIEASKQIGFWIAGFGHARSQPELLEIRWQKDCASGQVAFEKTSHGNLVFGGDAQRFVNQYCTDPVDGMYRWNRLPDQNIDYALKFHRKLYSLAESVQAREQDLFGGHKQQVQITRKEWTWTIPPCETGLSQASA